MKKLNRTIEYNRPMADGLRWVENIDKGLRFHAYADAVAKDHDRRRAIDHFGWFVDEFQDECYRGVVVRLPHGRFVAGYAQSMDVATHGRGNWDNAQSACLDLTRTFDDDFEAALAADEIARIYAERELTYQEAWQAGNRFSDLTREIAEAWDKLKKLARERYEARKARTADYPSLCAAVDNMARTLFESIQEAREERSWLESSFGRSDGFEEGQL